MNMFNPNNPYSNDPRFSNQGYDPNYGRSPGYSGFNNYSRPVPTLQGRMVNGADEITPQEVPMDGSVGLFPQNDFSCIYAKQWTKDGSIQTVRYIPETPQASEPQISPIEQRLDEFNKRFDKIEKMLSNNYQRPRYQKNYPKQKKEVSENE